MYISSPPGPTVDIQNWTKMTNKQTKQTGNLYTSRNSSITLTPS